jgi:uncharacterized protein
MRISELIWDDWNIDHITRHDVTPEEVEEVCASSHLLRKSRQDTYSIIGQTGAGRYLTIILSPKGPGSFYPVTARGSDNKEKRKFRNR